MKYHANLLVVIGLITLACPPANGKFIRLRNATLISPDKVTYNSTVAVSNFNQFKINLDSTVSLSFNLKTKFIRFAICCVQERKNS